MFRCTLELKDGLNAPAGPQLHELVRVARDAHAASGRDAEGFIITVSVSPSRTSIERLTELGVHRVIVHVRAPYVNGVARVHEALAR